MWKELQTEVDQLFEARPQEGKLFPGRRRFDHCTASSSGQQVATLACSELEA